MGTAAPAGGGGGWARPTREWSPPLPRRKIMVSKQVSPSPTNGSRDDVLVRVEDVKMYFPITAGVIFERTVANIKAVDGVSFDIHRGETLGLVGESGSGKTTIGRCILLLYKPPAGRIFFEGSDLTRPPAGGAPPPRPRMQMLLRPPFPPFTPGRPAGSIIAEPLATHRLAKGRRERRER